MKNVNSIVLIVAFIIIGVVVGVIVDRDKTPKTSTELTESSNSAVIVENNYHDFGDIDIFGGDVSADFLITNTGSEDVIITSGTTSCGCTEGEIAGEKFGMHFGMSQSVTIPADSSMSVTAIYDPLAHGPNDTGHVTRMLMLSTNSTVTPKIEIRLTANVTKEDSEAVSVEADRPSLIGVYNHDALESSCSFAIEITKDNDDLEYKYIITNMSDTNDVDEGALTIVEESTGIYFDFGIDNLGRAGYVDGNIVFQNYGNSMNEFENNYLSECNEKFSQFSK